MLLTANDSAALTQQGAKTTQHSVWVTTVVASLAVFFIALELTVIAVALPAMAQDFPGVAAAKLNQLFTAYNWVTAVLLLGFGFLADRYGRKKAFLLGLVLFGLGSAGCGLATTFNSLLGFRVLQAMGGAFMAPASLALILAATQSGAAQRNQALAVWGTMAGLAAALGPLLGAMVVKLGSWHWVFLAPVPLIAATALASIMFLAESRRSTATQTSTQTKTQTAVMWRQPSSFWWPTLASIPFVAAFTAWLVTAPLFFVSIWQETPTLAGLAVAPAPLAMAISAGPAARLANRYGALPITLAACCSGVAGLVFWLLQVDHQPAYLTSYLPGAILMGLAVGAGFPLLTAAAMQDVAEDNYAFASGVHTTARQLAMGFGAACAGWVLAANSFQLQQVPKQLLPAFQEVWLLGFTLFCLAAIVIARALFQRPHTP